MTLREPVILASQSPRRRELMALMGIPFEVCGADVDERCEGAPETRVALLARRKAAKIHHLFPGRVILSADTLVAGKDGIFGKPKDGEDAARMLRSLSGGWHEVFTGVCLIDGRDGRERERVEADRTRVLFSPLDDRLIQAYISTGEPMDKAGAYGIQGRGGMFVESLEGSYSNVVGFPMALVRRMLAGFEIQVL